MRNQSNRVSQWEDQTVLVKKNLHWEDHIDPAKIRKWKLLLDAVNSKRRQDILKLLRVATKWVSYNEISKSTSNILTKQSTTLEEDIKMLINTNLINRDKNWNFSIVYDTYYFVRVNIAHLSLI